MLQFTYIASALYLSSKSKPTNVKQLHQIRNLYQLWLNFISGFRPPLKALLAWVALPVEFSDPHGLFQGWSFFGPLNSLHFPRENPSTPSTEEDGWPMGTTPWLPAPSLPGGPVPTLIAGGGSSSPLKGVHTLGNSGENHSSAGSTMGCQRRWTTLTNLLPTNRSSRKFDQSRTGNNTLWN